jgi:hypothetical protein
MAERLRELRLSFPLFRHCPLYAGDPIEPPHLGKLDRPDKPGDDE